MKKKIKRIIAMIMATTVATISIVSSVSASPPPMRLNTYRVYYYLNPFSGVTTVENSTTQTGSTGYSQYYEIDGWKQGSIGDNFNYWGTGGGGQYFWYSISKSTVTFNSPTIQGGLLNTYTYHAEPGAYLISVSSNSPYVDVNTVLVGDANGDGIVDTNDYFLIMAFFNAGVSIPNYHAADVNGDGYVNPNDTSMLMQYLLDFIYKLA